MLASDHNNKEVDCTIPKHPVDGNLKLNVMVTQQNTTGWWIDRIRQKHGPWDYKWSHGKSHPEYDEFGNFNFGATGAAAGFSLNTLLRGAGWFKGRSLPKGDPYGHWYGAWPYGNQEDKQKQAIAGFNWFKNGCADKP
jgi:hypothetical protein